MPAADLLLLSWKNKLKLDCLLTFLLFTVMMDMLTGNFFHESLSIAAAGLFLLHVCLNRNWISNVFRKARRLTPLKIAKRMTFALLAASFVLSLITGIVISQSLFSSFLPEYWRMDLELRTLHVGFSGWFFFLCALHLGLHLSNLTRESFSSFLPALPAASSLPACKTSILLGALGIWAFWTGDVLQVLTFDTAFLPNDREQSALLFPAVYLFAFTGTALLPVLVSKIRSFFSEKRASFSVRFLRTEKPIQAAKNPARI